MKAFAGVMQGQQEAAQWSINKLRPKKLFLVELQLQFVSVTLVEKFKNEMKWEMVILF